MAKKSKSIAGTLVVYLIVAALLLGAGSAAIRKINESINAPKAMYVQHGDGIYQADNQGANVGYGKWSAKFTIKNPAGWGLYDVSECTVKVLPNTTQACNFTYQLGESETEYHFSLLKDVSAAFMENYAEYDYKGLKVDEQGNFELVLAENYTMETAIGRVHGGETARVQEEFDLESYPYFLLQITSPNGQEVIKLPFTLYELPGTVTEIVLDDTRIVF